PALRPRAPPVTGDADAGIGWPRQRETDLEIELLVVMVVAGNDDELVAQRGADLACALLRDRAHPLPRLVHAVAGTAQRQERYRGDRLRHHIVVADAALPVD